MKKTLLCTGMTAALFLMGYSASSMAIDGTVNITGQVTAGACTPSTQPVVLDTINAENITDTLSDGLSNAKPFSITVNCPDSGHSTLGITFDATNADPSTGYLTQTGSATGAAIAIFDKNGVNETSPLLIDLRTSDGSTSITNAVQGDNSLNFSAALARAVTGVAVQPGNIVGSLGYTVRYN